MPTSKVKWGITVTQPTVISRFNRCFLFSMLGIIRIFRTRPRVHKPSLHWATFFSVHSSHYVQHDNPKQICFPTDLNLRPPLLLLQESLALRGWLRWGEKPAHPAVAQACCPWDRIGTCLVGVSAGIIHNWLGGFDLGVRRRGRKGTQISFQPFWLIADPSQHRGDNRFSVHFVCLWS